MDNLMHLARRSAIFAVAIAMAYTLLWIAMYRVEDCNHASRLTRNLNGQLTSFHYGPLPRIPGISFETSEPRFDFYVFYPLNAIWAGWLFELEHQ